MLSSLLPLAGQAWVTIGSALVGALTWVAKLYVASIAQQIALTREVVIALSHSEDSSK